MNINERIASVEGDIRKLVQMEGNLRQQLESVCQERLRAEGGLIVLRGLAEEATAVPAAEPAEGKPSAKGKEKK